MYNIAMTKKYKEDYIYLFLRGYINISRKDFTFFNNINLIAQGKINRNFITTNQAKLFDKLTVKYHKQLDKEIGDATIILKSLWKTKVVETSNEHRMPKLYVNEDNIHFKVPYSSAFRNDIRHPVGAKYDKSKSEYSLPFNNMNFKMVHKLLTEHFVYYIGCNQINEILKHIDQYKEYRYWNPTLIERFGRYYIAGINETLHEKLANIELNDDFNTLYLLTQYGVDVEERIKNKDYKKRFASEFVVNINTDEVEKVFDLCTDIGLVNVCFSDYEAFNVTVEASNIITELKSRFSRVRDYLFRDRDSYKDSAFLCLFNEKDITNIETKIDLYSNVDIKKVICIHTI